MNVSTEPVPALLRHRTTLPEENSMRGYQSQMRVAETAAQITAWRASVQDPRSHYTPAELERSLGRSMRAVAGALWLLGWHREKVWRRSADGRRQLATYWVAPGQSIQRPQRGRPRFSLQMLLLA